MTVTEAAQRYGYSRRTILDAIERGAIRVKRAGRMYLLVEEDMAAYHERTGGQVGRPAGSRDRQPSEKRGRPRKKPEGEPS